MNLLLDLFLTFAKIGLFTFGGGYAMIALIENSCVEKKAWITHDDMMNITVIAESTPGPIAINCATYVGYRQKGLAGALCFPQIILICAFSVLLLSRFLAVRLSSIVLMLAAACVSLVLFLAKRPASGGGAER